MESGYKEENTDSELRNRRRFDRCRFIRFWHNWGPHLDFAGGLLALSMLSSIIWCGTGFVRDTQAANKKVYAQASSIALVSSRADRMDGNIQIMMNRMKLVPLKKTPTELFLEKQAPVIFVDESQSTNDNETQ